MLEQILTEIHNWFRVRDGVDGIHPGTYTIEDGRIALPFLQDGQYFRICGSVFNDGLHQYGSAMQLLQDETFTGAVWALAIPKQVVALAEEMEQWQSKNGEAASGIYQSESFGGYQYSKQTASDGGQVTVWSVFSNRLNPYRKLRILK